MHGAKQSMSGLWVDGVLGSAAIGKNFGYLVNGESDVPQDFCKCKLGNSAGKQMRGRLFYLFAMKRMQGIKSKR